MPRRTTKMPEEKAAIIKMGIGAGGATWYGLTLNEWVAIGTLIYLVLLAGCFHGGKILVVGRATNYFNRARPASNFYWSLHMLPYLTWATIVFAAALILVEWQDSRGSDLTDRPISHYFKTGTSVVQAAMFAVMAAALWITAWPMGVSWLSVSLVLVGWGTIVGMMSIGISTPSRGL